MMEEASQKADHAFRPIQSVEGVSAIILPATLVPMGASTTKKNNREVHLHYLKHLKESVETLREIVEEAKVDRPLDRSIVSACCYTKTLPKELLE
ncbi:hypothetical protein Tco_0536991 [Tanacetum coccineum]|uniref:Uncharacterized protein n=1 Tax=Tanacetum coccineum TaxID=301880 RepID=A0ABQ4WTN5_9ASTR